MTTYDQYGYDDAVAQPPAVDGLERDEALPGKALNANQKKAIAAALLGTTALGGAAYGLSRLEDNDGSSDYVSSAAATDGAPSSGSSVATAKPASFADAGSDIAIISGEPRLATTVSGDMTFDEAFAAARAEMGPGDYFEWHGDYYNTFYKEEWEGMSETEHQAFRISLGDLIETDGVGSGIVHGEGVEPVSHHHAPAHHVAHHAPAVPVAETVDGANVSVIDAIAGANSNVTVMHVDGHDISLIDTNNDAETDMTLADNNVVLVDTDSDHKLDSRGSYSASTHQVEHLQALDMPIGAPDMDAENRPLPDDYEPLYSGHDPVADHGSLVHHGHSDALSLDN